MQRISPVKIIAGIAAVILAVGGLIVGTKLRQGAVDILSAPRARPAATSAQQPHQSEGATPSGSRVIPIGVVSQPSSGNAGRSN